MEKYDAFYDAKDRLVDLVKMELIGPVADDEILDSKPLDVYVSGILWAQPLALFRESESDAEERREYETNCAIVDGQEFAEDEESAIPTEIEMEDGSDSVMSKAAIRKPSSMGIGLMLDKTTTQVCVTFSFGKYVHSEEEREYGTEGNTRIFHLYKRQQYRFNLMFDFSVDDITYTPIPSDESKALADMNIKITATKRIGKIGEKRLVTFSVLNNNYSQSKDVVLNENALFQCDVKIKALDGFFVPLNSEYIPDFDIEDEILSMQYKNVLSYAQGYGCATSWKENESGVCQEIFSEFVPVYETKQMRSPEVKDKELFCLQYLFSGNRTDIVTRLTSFVNLYHDWLNKQTLLAKTPEYSKFIKASENCLHKIAICEQRIRDGIRLLSTDDNVWQSFVLANKAMYYQRISMALMNNEIESEADFAKKSDAPMWYQFQLFYLLMIIPDFVDTNSKFKETVDLLWFPTGGGKTEAYLAVSAFIIFYERIMQHRLRYGTTIIMRYTLRLLTTQQFERAAALICSCERVRKEYRLGGNEISIGLWIGGDSTPNHISGDKGAASALEKLQAGDVLYEIADPVQITKCPYCGQELDAANYCIEHDHMKIICPHCGSLPIYTVDDDIYEYTPTLVISTVDKFARIVWEERAGRLFGCNIDTNKPRLIIQDELHLISGPLGTLTGLYESAVDRLCWGRNGIKPKIIASTATVKNAEYQVKGLYDRAYFQFPPSGLDYTDSFFAVQANKDEKPCRYYVGVSELGGSMTDLMIRLFSTLSIGDYLIAKEGFAQKVVDQYYTIIGYFNAIKELGTSSTVIRERMDSYIESLLNGKFVEYSKRAGVDTYEKNGKLFYKYGERIRSGELTSRKNATEVKRILNDLQICYTTDKKQVPALKYVLSSNMFSVGVDVNRLGLMVVYGQPKSNADYIQATGRVGRRNPGLVLCMYNSARSRDRSYYERFIQYHSCYYRYVEPTSVTPFSDRSIEKGLHSVFVALVRHLLPGMSGNSCAANFNKNTDAVKDLINYLLDRVKNIQPEAFQYAKRYLLEFSDMWNANATGMVYNKKLNKRGSPVVSLLISAEENNGDFSVLNSVRNVESSSNVFIDEGDL